MLTNRLTATPLPVHNLCISCWRSVHNLLSDWLAVAGRCDVCGLASCGCDGRAAAGLAYGHKAITAKNAIFGAHENDPSIIAKKGQKTKRIKRAITRNFDCANSN